MRSTSSVLDSRVALLGGLSRAVGVLLAVVGAASWVLVRRKLVEEHITVEGDADFFAGKRVAGPITAFVEAEIIHRHARDAADGKTYAELESGDPASDTVMNGSLLSASMFTAVIAFGVCAMATGMGLMLVSLGSALVRLNRRLSS